MFWPQGAYMQYLTGAIVLGALGVIAYAGAEAQDGCGASVVHTHANKVKKKVERVVEVHAGTNDTGSFYVSKMAIDADGAPNAYHPTPGTGLDSVKNAGFGSSCDVLVCKVPGKPGKGYVTTPSGPFQGFFVSQSSLEDSTKDRTDHERYVSATHIPYVAVPRSVAKKLKVQTGDLAYAVNLKNGARPAALSADIGTANN